MDLLFSMKSFYLLQALPESFSQSIYLVDSLIGSEEASSWSRRAIELLKAHGYQGVVFIPEKPMPGPHIDSKQRIAWEQAAMRRSDIILSHSSNATHLYPSLPTDNESEPMFRDGRELLTATLSDLEKTITKALQRIAKADKRSGSECLIPLGNLEQQSFSAMV